MQNSDIQELMLINVEARFNALKAPRTIQWLSDRGSLYRALEVKTLAKDLNLLPCYTAPYSPSLNGMAESFVGTIKRDYVYTNDCYSAKAVLKMLPTWFKDYNEIAPHSSLKMMRPREFIKKAVGVN